MTKIDTIQLPWPSKKLNPNERVHWGKKSTETKKAKSYAYYSALNMGRLKGPLVINVKFHPPDKRRRDMDNMIAACKAYFDGIALAVCVDDFNFNIGSIERGEPVKNGAVIVQVNSTE